MEIQEVAQILGLCSFLKVPKHVFITDEPVFSKENGVTFYRGLQPKAKHDAIYLSRDADHTTPIHETIHTLGLGEAGAEFFTRAIIRKNNVLQRLPLLRERLAKQVVYQEVDSSKDYPEAHSPEFQQRHKHYVLQQFVQSGNF